MKTQVFIMLFIFSLVSINGQSQNDKIFQYRNSLHIELGGSGGYYSINYERNIINHKSLKTSGQLGFSYFPGSWSDMWLPVGINEQFSFNIHHIELGIGFVFVREATIENYDIESKFWTYSLTGRVGYRYQKPDGRFIWRIGFTPILQRERIGLYYDPNAPFRIFTPMGGVSLGYSF